MLVSDVSVAPVPTGATGSASNDTVIIDTSSNTTIDTFDQSGSATTSTNHHRQSFGDEVTYVTNSSNLSVPEITTTTATTTLKTTTVAATTQVGFLTSEAEGNVETVVVPSSDISGSDETQQLSLMDAYPIGQVTSTYLSYYDINAPKHGLCCSCVALHVVIII
ncbi:unnamed protein product [Litomosoides sigmodontis]|uniref:Uncharacterized protein n=1 Tax=Litomosoides sigmodontis TaxID=42156 RepID=A0A3P6T4R5_LITSI|nr:unnamed protein product [Litomosoides sigmodontis]